MQSSSQNVTINKPTPSFYKLFFTNRLTDHTITQMLVNTQMIVNDQSHHKSENIMPCLCNKLQIRRVGVKNDALSDDAHITDLQRNLTPEHSCEFTVVRKVLRQIANTDFRPAADPLPRGVGWPKFNQLERITTFTYKPSLVRIDARIFELSW